MTMQKTTKRTASKKNLFAMNVKSAGFRRPSLPKRSLSTVGGACHFAYRSDLEKYLTRPKNEPYAPSLRFVRALLEDETTRDYDVQDDLNVYLPQSLLTRNIAVFGQIGSGKTQRVMNVLTAQAIADPNQSVVILGTKGDEYDVFSAIASELRPGGRVECLNFSDRRRSTVRWNPLDVVDEENAQGEVRAIAEMWHTSVIGASSGGDGGYFRFTSIRLIAGIALSLRHKYGRVSPRMVCDALDSLEKVRATMKYGDRHDIPFTGGVAEVLDGDVNKNFETTYMEAQAACQHLHDRDLTATTAKTTLDIGELFDEPTILVLEVPQHASTRVKPFLNMFFSQLFNRIPQKAYSSENRRLPRPLSIFVDDFGASVGRIDECAQRLNMMRSMDVRFTLALQSGSQLEQYYTPSEANAIVAACGTKIFLPPTSFTDARFASMASGECSVVGFDDGVVEEETESSSRRSRVGFLRESDTRDAGSQSDSKRFGSVQSRPLLLSSDVQYSPVVSVFGYAATIFLPETPPFQGWLPASYQLSFFEKALKAASTAPTRSGDEIDPEDENIIVSFGRSGKSGKSEVEKYKLFGSNPPVYISPCGSVEVQISQMRPVVGYDKTEGNSRRWWDAFERNYQNQEEMILMLMKDLGRREASIDEFFRAHLYSDTDHILANLYYMEYLRLKRESEESEKDQINLDQPSKSSDDADADVAELDFESEKSEKNRINPDQPSKSSDDADADVAELDFESEEDARWAKVSKKLHDAID